MSAIMAKCMMCGKDYDVQEDHLEYNKLMEQKSEVATFICDLCNNKVRYESDDKKRNPKSI